MPKTSPIRLAVSIELRLVTDRQTDRHRATASTRASSVARVKICSVHVADKRLYVCHVL